MSEVMTRLQDELREAGVRNEHGFFNGDEPSGQVWLAYYPRIPRDVLGPHWTVYQRGTKTNPDGLWYHYGNKVFSAFHPGDNGESPRAAALKTAQAWAGARYGISDWKRTPFGGYGDAQFVEARLAELRKVAR